MVTDCTELKLEWKYKRHLRLSAIKDLYDHSIIAWNIDDTETADLVTHTIDIALEENSFTLRSRG